MDRVLTCNMSDPGSIPAAAKKSKWIFFSSQAYGAKKDLAIMIAHDLASPVACIINFTTSYLRRRKRAT